MSRNQYDEDGYGELNETEDPADDSRLVRDLRKQLNDAKKRETDLTSRLSELEKSTRSRTVQEVLSSKGVSAKVAAFYPSDKEATPEAIDAWLTEYGDVFGAKPAAPEAPATPDAPDPTDPAFDPNTSAAYRRLLLTEGASRVPGEKVAEIQRSIAEAKSPEELTQALRSAARM